MKSVAMRKFGIVLVSLFFGAVFGACSKGVDDVDDGNIGELSDIGMVNTLELQKRLVDRFNIGDDEEEFYKIQLYLSGLDLPLPWDGKFESLEQMYVILADMYVNLPSGNDRPANPPHLEKFFLGSDSAEKYYELMIANESSYKVLMASNFTEDYSEFRDFLPVVDELWDELKNNYESYEEECKVLDKKEAYYTVALTDQQKVCMVKYRSVVTFPSSVMGIDGPVADTDSLIVLEGSGDIVPFNYMDSRILSDLVNEVREKRFENSALDGIFASYFD